MAYIFLSFSEHLNRGANSKNDFYNLSLNEQFELLQRRIPLERQVSNFNTFIETCFPTNFNKKYYISCPNFLREKHQVAEDKPSFLNNVIPSSVSSAAIDLLSEGCDTYNISAA